METTPQPMAPPPPLSPSDERTWAMLAHLSVLANLFTGFLGPIAALVIYLVYKERSRFVAYHAMQSFVLQLICWVGSIVVIAIIWVANFLLLFVVVGIILIPFTIVATLLLGILPLAALIYGTIAAIQTSQGQDFRYWLIGDWVRGTLEGPAS